MGLVNSMCSIDSDFRTMVLQLDRKELDQLLQQYSKRLASQFTFTQHQFYKLFTSSSMNCDPKNIIIGKVFELFNCCNGKDVIDAQEIITLIVITSFILSREEKVNRVFNLFNISTIHRKQLSTGETTMMFLTIGRGISKVCHFQTKDKYIDLITPAECEQLTTNIFGDNGFLTEKEFVKCCIENAMITHFFSTLDSCLH